MADLALLGVDLLQVGVWVKQAPEIPANEGYCDFMVLSLPWPMKINTDYELLRNIMLLASCWSPFSLFNFL